MMKINERMIRNVSNEAKEFFDDLGEKTLRKAENELRDIPDETQQEKKIRGFKLESMALNPRKIKLKSWLGARKTLLQDMEHEFGVKPVIVHFDAWKSICKQLGLFRLRVNNRSGVVANTFDLDHTRQIAGGEALFEFLFLSVIAGVAVSVFSGLVLGENGGDLDKYFLHLVSFLGPIGGCVGCRMWFLRRRKAQERLSKENGELHILFPDMTNPDRGESIAVDFADPPENLYSLVSKLSNRRGPDEYVQIVAHPDAFSVDPNQKVLEWADPTITIVRGNCVAILAQYGEFSNEAEAIKVIRDIEMMPI